MKVDDMKAIFAGICNPEVKRSANSQVTCGARSVLLVCYYESNTYDWIVSCIFISSIAAEDCRYNLQVFVSFYFDSATRVGVIGRFTKIISQVKIHFPRIYSKIGGNRNNYPFY